MKVLIFVLMIELSFLSGTSHEYSIEYPKKKLEMTNWGILRWRRVIHT